MTTGEIETHAMRGGHDSGDFDPHGELLYNVIPDFLDEIGDAVWLRRNSTITSVVGERDVELPLDFWQIRKVGVPDNYAGSVSKLAYYGENAELDVDNETVTEQNPPTSFKLTNATIGGIRTLRFNCPPDAEYVFPYSYLCQPVFLSGEDDVSLDSYIPVRFQWALVSGLRRALYEHRFGQGDQRWIAADREYARRIDKARKWKNKDQSRRGDYYKYAR